MATKKKKVLNEQQAAGDQEPAFAVSPKDPNDKRPHFINESGLKIHVRPIEIDGTVLIEEGLKKEYREKGKPIDPPVIEIEVAGGAKVKRQLGSSMLQVPGNEEETERRTKLWNDHQTALTELEIEFGKLSLDYVLDGIDEPMPEDDIWIRKCKHLKMDVPEDEVEREYFYKRHFLVKTPGDLARLQTEVMLISTSGTVDRKRVEAKVETFFRSAKLRIENMETERTEGQASEGALAA